MLRSDIQAKRERLILELLDTIPAEDCHRDGLRDTPKRVAKMYDEIFAGYKTKVEDVITVFDAEGYDQMVVLKDIEFFSCCEHHMLPFFGKAHIAYIPDGKIVGISKLARILDIFAKRLQNQERIAQQVAKAIQDHLNPKGVAIVIEAKHLCMCSRGVGKQNSVMKTSKLLGVFLDKDGSARQEFFNLIK
jgi:GTP cyclohydrolase I